MLFALLDQQSSPAAKKTATGSNNNGSSNGSNHGGSYDPLAVAKAPFSHAANSAWEKKWAENGYVDNYNSTGTFSM